MKNVWYWYVFNDRKRSEKEFVMLYAKSNNKYCDKSKKLKNYDKSKKSSNFMDLDVNNLYGWEMSWGSFKWVENASLCDKDLLKCCNEHNDEGNFLEVDVQYPVSEKLDTLHNDSPSLHKIWKIEKVEENLQPTCMIKRNIWHTQKI